MNKIISISIAAYNVEKSINETLDSFVIPEIMNDIEVIIVNDGSTDNTSQIAHNFSKKGVLSSAFNIASKLIPLSTSKSVFKFDLLSFK